MDSPSNLLFFLTNGVLDVASQQEILYGIVVNGRCSSPVCEDPRNFVRTTARALVACWQRKNIGYDFGAHRYALDQLKKKKLTFDYYVFLNCGVVGPILPAYMPVNWHWSYAFVDKLRRNVGLVGTSIVCLPPSDAGGFGPSVEGFAFAMSGPALAVVLSHGSSFKSHKNKISAILDGEYALTDTVMKHGFSIDSLLMAYNGKNWMDKNEWFCNNFRHPSRRGTYFGISMSPIEVIFHKVHWGVAGRNKRVANAPESFPVMSEETMLYLKWANDAESLRRTMIDLNSAS